MYCLPILTPTDLSGGDRVVFALSPINASFTVARRCVLQPSVSSALAASLVDCLAYCRCLACAANVLSVVLVVMHAYSLTFRPAAGGEDETSERGGEAQEATGRGTCVRIFFSCAELNDAPPRVLHAASPRADLGFKELEAQ